MMSCIISLFYKFDVIANYELMMNEMVMNQLIIFHKSNKKVRGEKMMDYLIHQTKHVTSNQSKEPSESWCSILISHFNFFPHSTSCSTMPPCVYASLRAYSLYYPLAFFGVCCSLRPKL